MFLMYPTLPLQVPAVSECSRQQLNCALSDHMPRIESLATSGEPSNKDQFQDGEADNDVNEDQRPRTVEITTSPSSVSSSAVDTPSSADINNNNNDNNDNNDE